jgi:hypothetical protein
MIFLQECKDEKAWHSSVAIFRCSCFSSSAHLSDRLRVRAGPSTAPDCLPRDSGIGDHIHRQSTQATTFLMPITMRLHSMTTTTSLMADDIIGNKMTISGGRYYSEAELALRTAHGCRRAIRGKGKLGEKAEQVNSSLPEIPGAPIFQFFRCSLVVNFYLLPHLYFTGLYYAGARWPGDLAPDNS